MIHSTAHISPHAVIGDRTRIWNWTQVGDGARIGDDCVIGSSVYIDRQVVVGSKVKIQTGGQLYRGVVVEDGVFIGPRACLTNDKFPRAVTPDGRLKSDADWIQGRILVCYGASIGAGAVVLADVTIGRFAMVGAGAVVVEDVPDYGLVLGTPGRLVGYVCVCGHRLMVQQSSAGQLGLCQTCGTRYHRSTEAGDWFEETLMVDHLAL